MHSVVFFTFILDDMAAQRNKASLRREAADKIVPAIERLVRDHAADVVFLTTQKDNATSALLDVVRTALSRTEGFGLHWQVARVTDAGTVHSCLLARPEADIEVMRSHTDAFDPREPHATASIIA
ncbi:MAG: hypothetical protein ABEI52_10415, partial [Halobacteriaceae archaeon]